MLKNIKSSYFLKLILLYLSEKNKMKLIKYNKYLQKLADRKLIHYRLLSERTLIYDESKKKGKEYDYEGIRRFEGEYLNGKRNGYGKEYTESGKYLIYDGEYLNGKRHGKGKEYGYEVYPIFEGEYKNGERNGKGIEYKDGKFEGEYLNGKRHGKGKKYDYNGSLIFEGEYLNGFRCKGVTYDKNGKIISRINSEKGKIKLYNEDNILVYEGEMFDRKKMEKEKNFIRMVK